MRLRSRLFAIAIAARSRARTANGNDANGAGAAAVPRVERGGGRVFGWPRRATASDRTRWARRALEWPLVNFLESAVWLGVALTLGVSYYGSYDNLVDVLRALGYAEAPARAVPIALDAPLTVSVIGQFLLARWKSPAPRRWRLFAVTLVTAPLSLAGNALHGALSFDGGPVGRLDLALLDLHRAEVVIRLVASMVPAIGVILAVAVTELVLRERARLEELREAGLALGVGGDADGAPADELPTAVALPRPSTNGSPTKLVDPRVLRVARAGGDWKRVASATGLGEHAAKRALTAARKQIAADSHGVQVAVLPAEARTDGEGAR